MNISINDKKGQIVSSFIKQFYSGTPYIPKELMIQEEIEDMELIEQWLTKRRGQRVYIRVPKKGTKEKLVELAEKNAAMVLTKDNERIKIEEKRTTGAMKEIETLLEITGLSRIEAFDISNISGFQAVGSMIVYEQGKPRRSDYRKFKIKSVSGPDDYASMYEVLTRRFTHGLEEMKELEGQDAEYGSFTKFPDLIMMDGGRGQVNIALKVLDELKLNIPVCGMVKDDNHRTRGLYFQNIEIPIEKNSEGFRLITRIQDEAHRFAIEYHRSLRGKGQVHSILDDIEGIGPVRRKALMKHFASIEDIKNAEIDTLRNVAGMNELAATKVYEFFHPSDK
jgi:excinuclease ABC subunit C